MELEVRIAERVGAGADPTHAQFGLLAGGELAVLSVPGRGTTVRATVPL